MVYENNIPKTETVYELKNDILSFEEFLKTYENDSNLNYDDLSSGDISEARGYGPCNGRADCKCSCNGIDECSCRLKVELVGYEESFGDSDLQVGYLKSSIKGKLNWDGAEVELKEKRSIFRHKNDYEEARYLGVSSSAKVGLTEDGFNVKGEAGIDLASYENKDGFKAGVRINADTGVSLESGVEVKFLGFGVSLGKKNGISTPLGGISKTDDNCVIQ